MSAAQRMEARRWWLAWAEPACTDLGARLAETIDAPEPTDPDIAAARANMIAAEALLAGKLER